MTFMKNPKVLFEQLPRDSLTLVLQVPPLRLHTFYQENNSDLLRDGGVSE